MKTKAKGISLIMLVITIIVLAILATTVILTLSNVNIIELASSAVEENRIASIKDAANAAYSDLLLEYNGDETLITEQEIREKIIESGIKESDLTDVTIKISNGVKVGNAQTITDSTTIVNTGKSLINYKIVGNSIQNGDPTPTTPVEVQSVGDKTSNLMDLSKVVVATTTPNTKFTYDNKTGSLELTSTPTQYDYATIYPQTDMGIEFEVGETYYLGADITVSGKETTSYTTVLFGIISDSNGTSEAIYREYEENGTYHVNGTFTYNGQTNIRLAINFNYGSTEPAKVKFEKIYFSKVDEFQPYGYKIPITVTNSEGTTTHNIYLDEPLRKIGEYEDVIDFASKTITRKVAAITFTGASTEATWNGFNDSITENTMGVYFCNSEILGDVTSPTFVTKRGLSNYFYNR